MASSTMVAVSSSQTGRVTLTNETAISVDSQGIENLTVVVHQSSGFAWTDSGTHSSGADDGAVYVGPVNYLQHEYIWSGYDGRAVATSTSNVFIHGGAGDDAISVTSGSNVLDGGGGSNFLTGGHGDDGGTDTFFVDVRGGQTVWDTIINFHRGDALTIWGFRPGITSMIWSENEGAAGSRGATLHAEINGAGTGVNASVTFAGLSVTQAQTKLGISNGSIGDNSYMYLHHDG